MAKVLLIKCSVRYYPFTIAYPLGSMYLSAVLKRDGGYETKIIDARLKELGPDEIAAAAKEYAPDIIGISSVYAEYLQSRKVSAAIKRVLPDVLLIIGGPYPTSDPASALKDENIGFAAIGEGERTFLSVVDNLSRGASIDSLPGLAFRENGAVRRTAEQPHIADLDTLPYPDWEGVSIPDYAKALSWSFRKKRPYMSLFTSRSCPYQCIYCHKVFGKGYRAHSPQRVFGEIKELNTRYGIRDFEILDDTFNLDRGRLIGICDAIIQSGMKINISFPNGVRADILDETAIKKLRRAGTIYMSVAIESGAPRIQKLIKKNLDLDKAREAIRIITDNNILAFGFFIFGFPSETREEMLETIKFATRSRLHMAGFFFATPVPGTELHEMVKDDKRLNFEQNSFQYYSHDLLASDLPAGEVRKIHTKALWRFYLNPFRLARLAIVHPDKKRFIYGAFQLFVRTFSKN